MAPSFLLYGSYGYTGRLIAEEALRLGLRPVLAGRNAPRLASQAERLGLDYRVFDLDNPKLIAANLDDLPLVLNCAGPFAATALPLVEACLQSRAHYLDITGELGVFTALAERDTLARQAGVMLLPGVGFDVVPSDCLAVHLKSRLPSATRLTLAFSGAKHASRGTITTALKYLGNTGFTRLNGRLVAVPLAHRTRSIDFGHGPERAASIPWGDLVTAFHSTGIPTIETFMALSLPRYLALRALSWLARQPGVKRFILRRISALPAGPSEAQRLNGQSCFWGEAQDADGQRIEAWLETPEAYTLTASAAVHIAHKALSGCAQPGYQTPASAYGPELVLELPGVRLRCSEQVRAERE
ncbi:MAG: saccharopine dehydrogenase NADP-binding domain-containing protein [Truepera sp.]|nr:saccharopine dehydrogenase NADP-binding domain-containing protein [Truepera sp.]